MGKVYITITGMKHYFGQDFLKPGMKIELIKEPDNEFDKEAIRAEIKGIGKIGETASAKVVYVLHNGVICKIRKKDLNDGKKKKEEPGGAEDGCDILVHIP